MSLETVLRTYNKWRNIYSRKHTKLRYEQQASMTFEPWATPIHIPQLRVTEMLLPTGAIGGPLPGSSTPVSPWDGKAAGFSPHVSQRRAPFCRNSVLGRHGWEDQEALLIRQKLYCRHRPELLGPSSEGRVPYQKGQAENRATVLAQCS